VATPVQHLLIHCGSLAKGERLVIVYDSQTSELARLFELEAATIGARVVTHEIPMAAVHGTEPPASVARDMLDADLVVGLPTFSMAHSHARLNASRNGARYLSLPEYSLELLNDRALGVDFRARFPVVKAIADAFTEGTSVHVTAPGGTDVRLDITGRMGNCCPGYVDSPGALGSPPDIEANVSPIETASNGVVVVDGSIPCKQAGLLEDPVFLEVADGRITGMECSDGALVDRLRTLFDRVGSDKAYVLAECGVGLNEQATLTGIMLTDEGAAGCMHFGFGSNATVGGLNNVPFHLDFVFKDASLSIDDRPIIANGKIVN
jgi:2,5-dihydroxypyridine 5,6-dioxygenase